ncbi:MAG: glycosyltransferase [Kiloniellaceae bacterium]
MIRVLFMAHLLDVGGAEVQLTALAKGLDRTRFEPSVITFYPGGPLEQDLRAAGIAVHSADKQGRREIAGFLYRVGRAVRRLRPDILYSYLDFPNVVAGLAKLFVAGPKVVWGVRASNMNLQDRDFSWRLCFALERLLVGNADLIICNSNSGRNHLVGRGFPAAKLEVIANGIDSVRFAPDLAARARLRAAFGVADHQLLIGLIARLDPMKDHPTFLQAAATHANRSPHARFICVADGGADDMAETQAVGRSLGLDGRLIWTGRRDDIPEVVNALDINTLSSAYGEGFPNIVGEAMACGVPCVVTDVGDSALVVGGLGKVVPPGRPAALAAAWAELAALPEPTRRELGRACRARIVERFPPEAMVSRTAESFERLVGGTVGKARQA